jgi:hypothetical protein
MATEDPENRRAAGIFISTALFNSGDLRLANCCFSGEKRFFTGERVKEKRFSNVL